jgi:hypothetical protein
VRAPRIALIASVLAAVGSARAQDATTETTPPPPPPPPPTTTAPTTPPPPTVASPAESFATDAHARFRFDAKIGSGLLGWAGLVPTLVAGAVFGRFSIGLGVSFLRGTLDVSSTGGAGSSAQASITYLGFAPTVQFDVVRSSDNRVALYALAALAPSVVVLDTGSGGGTCNGGAGFVLGYQAALGARYALHKQFMLGLEAGPSGAIATALGCSAPGSTNVAPGLHGMYGALVGTFVTP